ncbi:MAG: glycerate kinase type-2 family protein [Acidiphilium sp.]
MEPTDLLRALFDAAVAAAGGERVLPFLPTPPRGRTLVVAAGKAGAAMAQVVAQHWPAAAALSGFAVVPYGHGIGPIPRIATIEAAHPVPDQACMEAGVQILAAARLLGADDLLLCLMSGGASSLLTVPAASLSLEDKRAINRGLLRSGADIRTMNAVRKHLSAIKGGRLAVAAAPACLVTLAISDIPGDDIAVIGSGPTCPDPSTSAEALAALTRYQIAMPPAVIAHLADPASETPKPGDPIFARSSTALVATPADALAAAAALARSMGVVPIILGDAIEGESAAIGAQMAAQALDYARSSTDRPCVLLSGGETTVTLSAQPNPQARGGRNGEFLLALAIALGGDQRIYALACDTDGIDGSETNAGAIITPTSLTRLAAQGMHPEALLAAHASYTAFAALGDLIVTGPTRTNVNDFRAILIV